MITLDQKNTLQNNNNELINQNNKLIIEKNDLTTELNNNKKEIQNKDSQISNMNDELLQLENFLSEKESIINDLTKELESNNLKITNLENQINELTSELEKKNNTFLGEFRVSFYTPTDGSSTGITASGNKAIPYYTVAVDPSIIPLGTKLYIEGLGEAIAHDVGGAIIGNKLDYCVASTDEALKLGVKTLNVWILK